MEKISGQISDILAGYAPQLELVDEERFALKPRPDKWSAKEILGHLVDSAQNNLRRFIVAQYDENPLIVYQQDEWVKISNYQHYPTHELIQLWTLLNLHICRVLENTKGAKSQKLCNTNNSISHSIEWLAKDYIKHMLHHLHQILLMEPVTYP